MRTHKNKHYLTFVRFGVLKPVKQNGFGGEFFHSPPARYGFYAFTKPMQELFLIGCLHKTQPHFFKKSARGVDGDVVRRIRKEFKVSQKHEIWHHLTDVAECEVIQRHNDWVKTTVRTWVKSLMKSITKDTHRFKKPTTMGSFSKDAYEVFFEKI